MRLLFVLLAIVAAVLAFLMETAWLYLVAGGLLLVALGLLGTSIWKNYQKSQRAMRSSERSEADELRALGITDVRPRAKKAPELKTSEETPAEEHVAEEHVGKEREHVPQEHVAEAPPAARPRRSEAAVAGPPRAAAPQAEADTADEAQEDEGAAHEGAAHVEDKAHVEGIEHVVEAAPALLLPYLRALQAALGAHTVALMRQEDVGLEYGIEGLVSTCGRAQRGGQFSAPEALLTAGMSRREATLVEVGPEEGALLGYYAAPAPPVRQVVLAPVPLAHPATTYFLLADATAPGFAHDRAEALAARFADLLGFALRTVPEARAMLERLAVAEAGAEAMPFNGAATASTTPQDVDVDGAGVEREDEDEMQPRWQITGEEMERARRDDAPLALALAHLNRAEELTRRAPDELAAAEEALYDRLRAEVPEARIEPFGELVYGLFFRRPVDEVEEQAMRLQRALDEGDGALAGGVSIGLAMMRDRHADPNALRDDATTALREAHQSGTCTILE